MKKRINYITCVLMMSVSMFTYAAHLSTENIHQERIITFENIKKGHQLVIKNANLLIVYKEAIQQNGTYTKGFDLTTLPDGNYYFELEKDVEIQIIPFSVAANEVTFQKELETVIYKPTVFKRQSFVYLTTFFRWTTIGN